MARRSPGDDGYSHRSSKKRSKRRSSSSSSESSNRDRRSQSSSSSSSSRHRSSRRHSSYSSKRSKKSRSRERSRRHDTERDKYRDSNRDRPRSSRDSRSSSRKDDAYSSRSRRSRSRGSDSRSHSKSRQSPAAGEGALSGGTLGEELEMAKMTPAERLQHKMRKALEAADRTSEDSGTAKILSQRVIVKAEVDTDDHMRRAAAIEHIESDSFAPAAFVSSRTTESKDDPSQVTTAHRPGDVHTAAMFGSAGSTASLLAATETLTAQGGKVKVFNKGDNLAGHLWLVGADEKFRRWQHRLCQLRQRRRRM